MSGFTKSQSKKILEKSKQEFTSYLENISKIIPLKYDFELLFFLIQKYYPYEFRELNEIINYYKLKDENLLKKNIKLPRICPII